MKKNIKLFLLLILLFVLTPVVNVHADDESYARYGGLMYKNDFGIYQPWNHYRSASYNENGVKIVSDIFKFRVDSNNKIVLESAKYFELDNGNTTFYDLDITGLSCDENYCKAGNNTIIDYSQISSYYNKNKFFPETITVKFSKFSDALISAQLYDHDLDIDYVKKQSNEFVDKVRLGTEYVILSNNVTSSSFAYPNCPGYDNVVNYIKTLEKGRVETENAIKFGEERCEAIKKSNRTITDDSCFHKCVSYKDDLAKIDPEYLNHVNKCGLGEDMVGWLIRILKIIRYILPVIVIALSLSEYIGAIAASNDDAMKKAGKRFSARLLILIIVFLIPAILQLIFNIFNINGLSSDNPYCLK